MTQASFEAAFIAPEEVTPKRLDSNFYRATYRQAAQRTSRLPSAPLSSLVKAGTVITYGVIKSVQIESGVPMLRIQNLQSGFADVDGAVRISAEQHRGFSRSALSGGEVLIAIGGYVGVAAKYPNDGPIANINQHVAKVDIDPRRANDYYALAYFWSQTGTLLLQRTVTGTVQAGISLGDLRAFALPLPDRRIQDYIGAKVELAERCRAVAAQCESKSSDLLCGGLGQSTDDILKTLPTDGILPTGAFATTVDAELLRNRLDPSGYHPTLIALQAWASTKNSRFTPLRNLVTAETSKRSRVGKNCSFFVSVLHLNDRGFLDEGGARAYRPESGGREARSMDVLVSCINPAANRIGVCDFGSEGGGCSPEFSILRARNGVDPNYVAFALRTDLCRTQLLHLGRGTSSSRRRVDESDLLDVLVPTVECASAIAKTVRRGHVLSAASIRLINEAKADVEALIDGTLDEQAILAGTLKAPTANDIPELAEDDA
ncbi:hypothetical protein [Streptomyces hydrogenans]